MMLILGLSASLETTEIIVVAYCRKKVCGERVPRRVNQQSHDFLYSGGAFARLYPVNLSPARNHAAKPKRRPHGRGRFALNMWGLVSVPYSRLKTPRMDTRSWHGLRRG